VWPLWVLCGALLHAWALALWGSFAPKYMALWALAWPNERLVWAWPNERLVWADYIVASLLFGCFASLKLLVSCYALTRRFAPAPSLRYATLIVLLLRSLCSLRIFTPFIFARHYSLRSLFLLLRTRFAHTAHRYALCSLTTFAMSLRSLATPRCPELEAKMSAANTE
jgi:hypothetical protein